jgi:2-C-methyl-D-erythritol 2,4-cyclodiphosphate synthase
MKLKVGQGIDVHAFGENLPLIIGGVHIPHTHGLIAHSDGDVLLHAICDSLLGAAGLQDIGYHFPDTSLEFKNIDSRILLRKTYTLITDLGYSINNIDCTICLERPKLLPHIQLMKENIASDLHIPITDIAIKATTTEKLGFVGRKEGIIAFSTCLLLQL